MNNKVGNSEALYEVRKINNLKEMIYESTKLYKDNVAFRCKRSESDEDYQSFLLRERQSGSSRNRESDKFVDITYAKLEHDLTCLGTALFNLGLSGKRIAVIGANSYYWGLSYLGTVCGVGVVVPLDKALPKTEIENILMQSEASAIFFDEKYTEAIKEIRSNLPSLEHLISFGNTTDNSVKSFNSLIELGDMQLKKGDTSFIDSTVDNDAMNMMLFTSGTTANSKAVMLSHTNICTNIMQIASVIKLYEDDVYLSFLPIHHAFECTISFLMSLYNGSCLAICRGLKYVSQDLIDYKATIFCSVPLVLESMYKKVLKEIELSNNTLTKQQILDMFGGKLRFIFFGAAPLGKDIIVGYKNLGIHTHHGYGLTETSPALTVENDKYFKSGSVGYCLPGVEAIINNPDETGLGEIICKGQNLFSGYYNNKEATDEVVKDGWFYTGDLGYVDNEGYLFISGRKKNVIVLRNGKNVFPEEIEVLINNNPLVAESMVYSSEKPDGNIELRTKIVYNKEAITAKYGEISENEIQNIMNEYRKELNRKLPLYKAIRKVSVTDVPLIKTTTNKIRRIEERKIMGV